MTKARDIASAAPAPSTVSATELGYLDGVTSNIQTQIDSKTGGVATDTPPASPTEGQVWLDTDGTTADANFSLTSHNHNSDYIAKTLTTTTGDIIYASAANTPARLAIGSTDQVLKVSGGIPAWGTLSSAMTQLADTTLSSAAADITFSSISSSYNHLMVIISGRCSHTGTHGTDLQVRLNSDTGNNYSSARNTTYATSGGTVTILGNNGSSSMLLSNLWVGKVSSDYVANVTLYFPDYKNTTLNKTMNFSGGSYSDAPAVGTGFARWTNTSAITTIRLFSGAGNFDTGTRATLYGLV